MLSKVSKTFRSFVVGPEETEKGSAVTRKRQRDEYDELEDFHTSHTPTKKLRQDIFKPAPSRWYHFGKVAEWIVRKKKSFSESYYFRKVTTNASPKQLVRHLRNLTTGQPQAPGDTIGNYHSRDLSASSTTFPDMDSCARSHGQSTAAQNSVPATQSPTPPGNGAPRQPKTGYVDLPYPFVFPPDVIWTQDGQFKIPPPKPSGAMPVEQHGSRPPLRLDQRPQPPGSRAPLCSSTPRPPVALHGNSNSYKPIYDKVYNKTHSQSSSEASSQNSTKLAAKESIRLEEKNRYARLLQQFTNVPLSGTAFGNAHIPQHNKGSFSITKQRTTLGSRIPKLADSQMKFDTPELSRIDVLPRRTQSPQMTEVIDLTEKSFSELQKHREKLQPESGARARPQVHFQHVTPTVRHSRKVPRIQTPGRLKLDDTLSPQVIVLDSPESPHLVRMDCSRSSEVIMLDSSGSPDVILLDSSDSTKSKSPRCRDFDNSLKECKYTEEWLKDITSSFSESSRKRDRQIQEEEMKRKFFEEKREQWENELEERIRHRLRLAEREKGVFEYQYEESEEEESEEEEEEEADEFPELDDEQEEMITDALVRYPANEVISEGFRLQIRRCDMETLKGLNWLNDEVVNFYFELIRERGKLDNLPSVHIFNTFFYPKVKSQGQQGVRRWTKQVDIYTFDYIAIPIHLGMHWCLAVVDFRKKAIRYFDSMGGRNMECLNILKKYLKDESMQKKGQTYDMSDWILENVTGLPQQMNGSDCGVFTCKYAEYVTRDRPVSFTQANMPYFRRRMVYEILTKQLL